MTSFFRIANSSFGFKQRYCCCLLMNLTRVFPDLYFLMMENKKPQQLMVTCSPGRIVAITFLFGNQNDKICNKKLSNELNYLMFSFKKESLKTCC